MRAEIFLKRQRISMELLRTLHSWPQTPATDSAAALPLVVVVVVVVVVVAAVVCLRM